MSRMCCVSFCNAKNDKENNSHFFNFPKDVGIREKWEIAIGTNLKECRKKVKEKFVCSQHFRPDDIDTQPVTILKDGKEETVPRKRARLKRNAVPFIYNGNTVYATENVHLSKQCESPVMGTVSSYKMEILVGKINSTEESSNEASSCLENVKQAGHDETITLDTASTNDMKVSIAQIDTTEKFFGSMEQTVQHEALTLDTTSTDEIEGPAKSSKDDLSRKGDSDMFLWQEIINLKSEDLSRNWISVVVPVGVLFLYYSEGMSYGTRTVLIKWDMTTEIRGGGRLAAFPTGPPKIVNVTDVILLLHTVGELYLCEGNGYGDHCADVFFKSAVKPRKNRCDRCRSYHKRLYLKMWREKQRFACHKERNKKIIKNLKRKLKRRNEAIANANNDIERFKEQCSKVSEEALASIINALSENQQEAIKACIHASKCCDLRGVRYTNPWILNCILLRIKSRSAYEHCRRNKILALPTINTLNTYMSKMKAYYGFRPGVFSMLKAKSDGSRI